MSKRSVAGSQRSKLSEAALNRLNIKNDQPDDVVSTRSRRSAVSQDRRSKVPSYVSSRKAESQFSSNEDDEWVAIQKFNTLLHYEEQKQILLREAERKKLIKEELDRQVAAKAARSNSEKQESNLYNEMHEEHRILLEQREVEKQDIVKQKIMTDK